MDSFNSLIVKVFMPQTGSVSQRVKINREAMILGRYFHFAGGHIHDWQIGPMIAERELDSFASKGKSKQLMTQTYAEYRLFPD